MEKENWDPDFQPPKKKARCTKVMIDKHFAKAKTVDEVADITKGSYLQLPPKILTGLIEYLKSGVVRKTRTVLVMRYVRQIFWILLM